MSMKNQTTKASEMYSSFCYSDGSTLSCILHFAGLMDSTLLILLAALKESLSI